MVSVKYKRQPRALLAAAIALANVWLDAFADGNVSPTATGAPGPSAERLSAAL